MDTFLTIIKEFPWFADLVMLMGTSRVVFKPLVILIDTLIKEPKTTTDDEKWAAFQKSKYFRAILFVLDYFASVKIRL